MFIGMKRNLKTLIQASLRARVGVPMLLLLSTTLTSCSRQLVKQGVPADSSSSTAIQTQSAPQKKILYPREPRLKQVWFEDFPIVGDRNQRTAEGMWMPETTDLEKILIYPEQVKLVCTRYNMSCREIKIVLGLFGGMVSIMDVDDGTNWQIDMWDSDGLTATYGPAPRMSKKLEALMGPNSEACHRHILTMSFSSGAVSTSDIPTHEKGCEVFVDTDSYRLVRGNYYIDTTPKNDVDKK